MPKDERKGPGHYEMRLGERWVPIKHEVLRDLASQYATYPKFYGYSEMIEKFIIARPDDYRYVKEV